MRGTRIEKEVEICATNLANKVHEHQCKEMVGTFVRTCNIYSKCNLWSNILTLETDTFWKLMKNLLPRTDLLCVLETSLLMRGIQIGEMSKLGWLIGLDNMPYGPIPCIFYTCCY
jgi:hypothetical protein